MYIHVPKDEKCPPRKLNNVCYPSYFKKPTNGICWKENVINVYWWQRISGRRGQTMIEHLSPLVFLELLYFLYSCRHLSWRRKTSIISCSENLTFCRHFFLLTLSHNWKISLCNIALNCFFNVFFWSFLQISHKYIQLIWISIPWCNMQKCQTFEPDTSI